jgi:hypothetical protein
MEDLKSFLDQYIQGNPILQGATDLATNQAMSQARKKSAGEVYQAMRKEVENMSWPQKAMIAAGHETDKLVSGTRDLIDTVSGIVGSPQEEDVAIKSQFDRANEQAALDELYSAFKDNAGISPQLVGGALPYVLDSVLMGPYAAKGAGKVISSLGKGVEKTAKVTGQASKTLIQRLAEKEGLPGHLGQRMQKEWVDPIAKTATRFKNQIPEYDPYRKGAFKHILGDVALGGLEGGLHYDNSIEGGALASGMGSVTGQVIKPALHRSPSFYTDNEKRLVEWGKDRGYKFLPGMETGHQGHQMFENDLRGSSSWTDVVNQIDRNNNFITNRIAFEQLGVPVGQLKELNPTVLKTHMKNLSNEYEDFVSKTQVRFEPSDFKEVQDTISGLNTVGTKPAIKTANLTQEYLTKLEDLRRSQMPVRDPLTGRMRKSSFGGSIYQDFRRDIKSQINQAYDKQDTSTADALSKILRVIDTGIERGARDFGGEVSAKQWKDLNERWALSNLIMEKGMDPLGMVDGTKLGKYFMETEPKRYLMESAGPKMTELQKAAKLEYMTKNQKKGGLFDEMSGLLHNPGKKSALENLLSSPFAPATSFTGLPQLSMALYKRGWPSKWGLLGFEGSSFTNAPTYARSLGQSSQFYPSMMDAINNAQEYLSGLPKKIREKISPTDDLQEFLKGY